MVGEGGMRLCDFEFCSGGLLCLVVYEKVDGVELGRWLVGAKGRRVCRCSGGR